MQSRIQFVLAALLCIIMYETYLVVYYKYQDYQVNTYITTLEKQNQSYFNSIAVKKKYLASVQTNAYIDRMMKTSQNRRNPGEDVVFLVDKKSVADYRPINTSEIIAERKIKSETIGMTTREKWAYYLFGIEASNN
jgi:hypothetical protein